MNKKRDDVTLIHLACNISLLDAGDVIGILVEIASDYDALTPQESRHIHLLVIATVLVAIIVIVDAVLEFRVVDPEMLEQRSPDDCEFLLSNDRCVCHREGGGLPRFVDRRSQMNGTHDDVAVVRRLEFGHEEREPRLGDSVLLSRRNDDRVSELEAREHRDAATRVHRIVVKIVMRMRDAQRRLLENQLPRYVNEP